MNELNIVKASELPELSQSAYSNGSLVVSTPTEVGTLPISEVKAEFLNNSQLTGDPQAPTPNNEDDSTRIATTAWVQDELSGLGLNPATSSQFGTVLTHATDAVPVVYLKSEVDTLLNQVRPIDLGGTGATTAEDARAALMAAKSGVNTDITSLSSVSLADGSTAVTKPANNASTAIATTEYADRAVKNRYSCGVVSTQAINFNGGGSTWQGFSSGGFVSLFNSEASFSSNNGAIFLSYGGVFIVTINCYHHVTSGSAAFAAVGVLANANGVTNTYNLGQSGLPNGSSGGSLIIQVAAAPPNFLTFQPVIYWGTTQAFTGQAIQCHFTIERVSL